MASDNFRDNDHALFTGALVGFLMTKGIQAAPQVDDDGDYTDVITVEIEFGLSRYKLDVTVAPGIRDA